MNTFASILDAAPTSVERPKPVPVGTYLALITGMPRFDKSKQKQTDFVEFTAKLMQAREDVDPQALLAAGGLDGKSVRVTFYLTEDSVYRLDIFLFEHLGIPFGTPRKQACAEAMGKQVYVTIAHQSSQDGSAVYANVAGTAKV